MADVFWGTEFKMAAGSRVSAEKRLHNITAIVKDQVFVNFLVLPDTLLRENLDFVNTESCHCVNQLMPSCWRNDEVHSGVHYSQ